MLALIDTLSYGQEAIQNRIITTQSQELVLIEEVLIEAPVRDAWKAYTTAEGMMAWSAPLVEVDLRAGGSIRSLYDTNLNIGDPGTINLRIVNYVPERLLTLQAEQAESWPEVMKQDRGNLMNVIFSNPLARIRPRYFHMELVIGTFQSTGK